MSSRLTRRTFLSTTAAAAAGALAAPAVLRAQPRTLKITTWGGKWGEIMKGTVLPAFEKQHNCAVSVDSAFPFLPKLMSSSRSDPVYDVMQTNNNEQWQAAVVGVVEPRITKDEVSNLADCYDFAYSDKVPGVTAFVSAIGVGYRTDQGLKQPTSWKDMWNAELGNARAIYVIPINSLGQCFFMMAGQVFGGGLTDLDAAFDAMEKLKPVRLVDFTGTMEKMLLSGEVKMGVIHDSGIYRYHGQNLPIAFSVPSEGVLALEQVLSVTKGSKVKDLAYAYIDYMLDPGVQKLLCEAVWYSPANKKVKLGAEYDAVLFNTEDKVKQLIQPDWKWYNSQKDMIDARLNRIFRA